MEKNVGKIDKIVRIVFALVIAYLDYTEAITGTTSWVLSIVALVLVVTAFIGFCPLYKALGINTNKV